ncbi:GntR family transcriptional regulator [Bacillus marinisedimentorum]|uniref:GntR family transcriptional regulator n=1 Tax=Bacillus marinisedimentorum TaxID=1821260 RepID=UPI0007DF61E9|nr:GntR family transcriptional regulator [Bacillus marinisedimentorum]
MEANQTKYNFVKEEIKKSLLRGDVLPGQKIGSENEMMTKYQVSRHTVRKAIDELVNEGYLYREHGVGTFCKNWSDRTGRQDKKTIGIITTYISDYIFPSIIRGAELYLSSKGYSLVIASTNNDVKKEQQCLQSMMEHNLAGLIIEPTKSAFYNENLPYYINMSQNKFPFIMINASYEGIDPPTVTLDDEYGTYILTKHLIELGHKRIIGIFKTDDKQGLERMKGFFNAHKEFNLPVQSDLIVTYETENKDFKPGENLIEILENAQDKPTGIVPYNDELAIHIINVLRDRQIKIPKDISIVGFDDSSLSETTEVKLTTVKHPKSEMGRAAAQLIVSMIEGKGEEVKSVKYRPELVQRKSVDKPNPLPSPN